MPTQSNIDGGAKAANRTVCRRQPRNCASRVLASGVISKPANESGPELLEVVPDRELSKQGKSGLFPRSSKKTHSEVRSRVFLRSSMVLVMAFLALRGRSATCSSSSVVHI